MIADDFLTAIAKAPTDDAPRIGARRFLQLALRCWPFIRPLLKHLIVFLIIGALSALFIAVLWAVASDLLANKVLVGDRLQPMQGAMLGLGEDYVTTNGDDEAPLSAEQRKVVRDRLLLWFGLGGLVILGGLAVLPYYGTWIRHGINQNLRVAMIERAEHLSLKYHNHARVGDAVFRVYQDSAMIVNLIEETLLGPLGLLFWMLVAVGVVFLLSPAVALACVLVAVPVVWLAVRYTPRIRRRARANRMANSDLTSRLQESFAAIRVVKANRAEERILERFNEDSERALDAAFFLRLEMVLLSAVTMTLGGAVAVGAEYVLAGWALEDRSTYLGAAVAGLIGFTVWNLGAFRYAREQMEEGFGNGYWLIRVWCMAQDLFICLERAFYLLDLEPDIVDGASPRPFPQDLASIAVRDLHFAYEPPEAAPVPVLRGIDLEARAGTITAIVGATGAGKSTLMSMVLRLYDPGRGAVLFDDVDLRDLRVDDIRTNTAIALQKNVLFAGSVADNIGYAARGKGRADIEAAARVACADEFIVAMDAGYDTELGERGGKLSAGQRQRLSIARAVVRDTPILILDEPTASLDAATESRLLGNLAEWGAGRVVFLITHRLSTIRNADRIAFMDQGRIAEFGEHDELMALPGGRYRSFVEAETTGAMAAG